MKFDSPKSTSEEDSDVFEITDFTTASEWERFIARLEEVLHEWKLIHPQDNSPLPKGALATGKWEEHTEQLSFADFKFNVTRHCLQPHSSAVSDKESKPSEECLMQKSIYDDGLDRGDDKEDSIPRDDSLMSLAVEGATAEKSVVWTDLLSLDNDFPNRCHCIARWFGLRDFLVLTPVIDITNESRSNIVLSSIAIAVHNTSCQMPIFLLMDKKWRRLYFGHCEIQGFSTSFEMVHLKTAPSQYKHLAGLLDVFKGKLNSPGESLPPTQVAVRLTYLLQDWPHYTWPQQPPDIDAEDGGTLDFSDLPFGACEDPVSELQLSATWPSLSEEMIVDSAVYSDLDPLQAPQWSIRIHMNDDPQCLLGYYLEQTVKVCRRHETTDDLIGSFSLEENAEEDLSQALNKIAKPDVPISISSLGTVVTKATTRLQVKPDEAPINLEKLTHILQFLFPDAKDEGIVKQEAEVSKVGSLQSPSFENIPLFKEGVSFDNQGVTKEQMHQLKEKFEQFKSAPSNSLTNRLATCICILNQGHGGLKAIAHIWQEFVLEMRYRWEHNYPLPDLGHSAPNLGSSLLHQKLQMLNCCIRHKMGREAMVNPKTVSPASSQTNESQDEEFFECDEEEDKVSIEEEKDQSKDTLVIDKSELDDQEEAKGDTWEKSLENELDISFQDSLTYQPEGRLRVCGELSLLGGDTPLYIPVTQEPAPMTEDQLEEHAEVLAKLGTSSEGATLRARMQSACLLSDMEAFKAANPGCVLADFVRWYSPRDWIEEEIIDEEGNSVKKGQLSARMQIPGNMWLEVWQSAKPVPVRRQRRLFDDTKEAEKVLHFFASMKPADVTLRLLPMLVHAALEKITQYDECFFPTVFNLLEKTVSSTVKILRKPKAEIKSYESLCRQIVQIETLITRAQSLTTKFSTKSLNMKESGDLHELVSTLLESGETNIIGAARAPIGEIIHSLFAEAQKSSYLLPEDDELSMETVDSPDEVTPSTSNEKQMDFPAPSGKEYILRTSVPRPSPWSRPSPQRMFCTVLNNDFRLAGAFTSDTTFQ